MWLCFPYYRPDFDDDDDEGNKLFRYICLSLFCHEAKWGGVWIVWAAETTSNVFSVFHQVWRWNSRLQQWQRALCQVGGCIRWNKCVWMECRGAILLIQHLPPCCSPCLFFINLLIFTLTLLFYFGSGFWACVLVGWFHFQVFGRRSEFCR